MEKYVEDITRRREDINLFSSVNVMKLKISQVSEDVRNTLLVSGRGGILRVF